MSALGKLIVLTPQQLRRLQGLDHIETSRFDAARQQALHDATNQAPQIGPTQAYVQYQQAQQRHLQHAHKDRTEPLQIEIAAQPPEPQRTTETQTEKKQTGSQLTQTEPERTEKNPQRRKTSMKKKSSVKIIRSGRIEKKVARVLPRVHRDLEVKEPFVEFSPRQTRGQRSRTRKQVGAGWLRYTDL